MNDRQEINSNSQRGAVPKLLAPRRRVLSVVALFVAVGSVFALALNGNILKRAESKSSLTPQGAELDYSKFTHTSQKHASLACTSCHQRTADNSVKPLFPGHKACTNCHLAQFVTAAVPMCLICHSDVKGKDPPRKAFPSDFKEKFNVKFDHVQHMTGSARPEKGCVGCHDRPLNRGVALSIPAGLTAHNDCYICHTPSSKASAGREIASCGVCHDQKPFVRTSTNARAYRAGFSHRDHGPRERLECAACHSLTAGLPPTRQVSSPRTAEHLGAVGGMSCMTCHNGRRSFGGDLAFKDCKRCHTGPTFRTPI